MSMSFTVLPVRTSFVKSSMQKNSFKLNSLRPVLFVEFFFFGQKKTEGF